LVFYTAIMSCSLLLCHCMPALLFGTGSAWIICLGTPNRLISCDHIES
jgi:hypothetical protein